jgi:hypothetical protein
LFPCRRPKTSRRHLCAVNQPASIVQEDSNVKEREVAATADALDSVIDDRILFSVSVQIASHNLADVRRAAFSSRALRDKLPDFSLRLDALRDSRRC